MNESTTSPCASRRRPWKSSRPHLMVLCRASRAARRPLLPGGGWLSAAAWFLLLCLEQGCLATTADASLRCCFAYAEARPGVDQIWGCPHAGVGIAAASHQFSSLQPLRSVPALRRPRICNVGRPYFLPGTRMAVVEAASTVVRQTSSRHLPIAHFAVQDSCV